MASRNETTIFAKAKQRASKGRARDRVEAAQRRVDADRTDRSRSRAAALGHGVAHALAEEIGIATEVFREIGIATEVFSRRERDRREDWRLVRRKIPTSIRPVRNYDEASLGPPCNGSFSIVQQAN